MPQFVRSKHFALLELGIVILCGAVWMVKPEWGIWFILIALLPIALSVIIGRVRFKPLDLLVLVFTITAWVGYWAAYDKTTAWIKVWLIVTTVLLYFSLSIQPKQNLEALSIISFVAGIGISIYFFLTHNFVVSQGGIALWWMENRPKVSWIAIHRGYISGLIFITGMYSVYWLRSTLIKPKGYSTAITFFLIALGTWIIAGAFILSASRGIWMVIACVIGVWVLWKISVSNRFVPRLNLRSLFPVIVLVYLGVIIVFIYIGSATIGGDSANSVYGQNTRPELLARGAYFLVDFPITGAGLNSFPGMYSQYMIGIPFYYFVNSYNIFLDVAIEQGIFGGLAFFLLYLMSVWYSSQSIMNTKFQSMMFYNWLSFSVLIFTILHGQFYDYLYNHNGVMLLLFPIGMSMVGVINPDNRDDTSRVSGSFSLSFKGSSSAIIVVALVGVTAILVLNINKITSTWYSNRGAVQMSQVELADFPTNKWTESSIVSDLEPAEASLHSSLQFNPTNRTANQRLGMISMLRRDFVNAGAYLETAHKQAPLHRGIIKSLGYCYVWLGDMEKAQTFLMQIPEAKDELDVYTWWWETQGRNDLSGNAALALKMLYAATSQP